MVWRIDPDGGRFGGRLGRLVDEAVRVGLEGLVEDFLASGVDVVALSVVDLVRRHQADAKVVMVLIVPVEEARQKALASWKQPNRFGNWGWYFRVLKQLSEKGLSLEV